MGYREFMFELFEENLIFLEGIKSMLIFSHDIT